jgi:mRNA degradation ribonuclease J1/J2
MLPSNWPIYCSEETAKILPILNIDLTKSKFQKELKTWKRGGYLSIIKTGPFIIEPRLTAHSAFDAYNLLIKVDGR